MRGRTVLKWIEEGICGLVSIEERLIMEMGMEEEWGGAALVFV